MKSDWASIHIKNINNKVTSYNHDRAIVYKKYEEENISSKKNTLKIKSYSEETLSSKIEPKSIRKLIISEEDVNDFDNILYNKYNLNNYENQPEFKESSKRNQLYIYHNDICRFESHKDIETTSNTLTIVETPIFKENRGYSTLSIVYDGPIDPNKGNGAGLKYLKYTGNLNTFLEIKLDFTSEKISSIKGLPAGLELYNSDNIIKGIPKTHGLFNCEVILSNDQKIKFDIEISAIVRKF